MLELIDQSTPGVQIYRCSECQATGISNPNHSEDNYFWLPTPGQAMPGRWVRHECRPVEPEAPKRKKANA